MQSMKSKGKFPLAVFPINDSYLIGVYQGSLSEFDILIKYRQKGQDGRWSRIRTPKHIHWAVDILIKMHLNKADTERFLNFLIDMWKNIQPLKSDEERDILLNVENLINTICDDARDYESLANQGVYSIKFLILVAKLLMIQEKTNMENAFMFKKLLDSLKTGTDIFKIVSVATHNGR